MKQISFFEAVEYTVGSVRSAEVSPDADCSRSASGVVISHH